MITHEANFTESQDEHLTLTHISVIFYEDGVDIMSASITVQGDETVAGGYLPVFIKDLEFNFPHIKNIEPEPDYPEMEGEMTE